MDLVNLQKLCLQWNKSGKDFARLVAAALRTADLYRRELAAQFDVAESTVTRWAKGTARPHPLAQKSIVTAIERRVRGSLRAKGTSVRRTATA